MKFIQVDPKHKEKYTKFVNRQAETTCFQMWQWSESRNVVTPCLYNKVGVINKHEDFLLTASYSVNSFKLLGNILYIPQGPIWTNKKALRLFVDEIKKIANKNRCIAIICVPRIKKDSSKYQELITVGFKFTNEAVQPRTTVLLDLEKTEEELLASFSKTTRYNIRYAERKGVEIRSTMDPSDTDSLDRFYKQLLDTQKRKYFLVQSKDYFISLWHNFSRDKSAQLLEAFYNDEYLASIFMIYSEYWAGSLFSASSRKHSNLKATYALRWASIQNAKNRNCTIYDFIGATNSTDPSHPFYHTTQFKLAFGRKTTNFAGTFEIILNPIKYAAWRLGENLGFYKFYEKSYLREFSKRNRVK